ncbi:UvrD-helicase domain-containing protein [Leptolyngbya sp. AN03gr2]|uniref:UvrD-helicase domain-containing protein n=1 Tax=Leptolyngbya sp. AN03gr2 TaxID=3423364 RepID=UPI003D31AE83
MPRKKSLPFTEFNGHEMSKYQQDIAHWVISGQGDACIKAMAGSSKTTVLEITSRLIKGNALFCAFSKDIQTKLQRRLPKSVDCKTIHSLGFGALAKSIDGKLKVDGEKYRVLVKQEAINLVSQKYGRIDLDNRFEAARSALSDLLKFSQTGLVDCSDHEAFESMIEHYGIDTDEFGLTELAERVDWIKKLGMEAARQDGLVDYIDMIWLPVVWHLPIMQYQWVLVDEAQDLSKCQLEIVMRARAQGGRMLLVADPRQAIFGFAGADAYSYQRSVERLKTKELPLSICYRCPVSHLELAKKIVPEIEAALGAKPGTVERIKRSAVAESVKQGDLIISRTTAPLVKLCIELIGKKIAARVVGRDIGKSLGKIVRETATLEGFTFDRFLYFLEQYKIARLKQLSKKKNSESQQQSLIDRIQGVEVCYSSYSPRTADELCKEIDSLFTETKSAVTLMTIHRVKGQEAARVFILNSQQIKLTYPNQKPWEKIQEENLEYVAYTRSTDTLFLIEPDPKANVNAEDKATGATEERYSLSAFLGKKTPNSY